MSKVILFVVVAAVVSVFALPDARSPEQIAADNVAYPSSSSGALIATISNGEEVDLEDHLVDGRKTVVYFYADW